MTADELFAMPHYAEGDMLHGGEAVPQFSCVVATLFGRM
jgi:hypothetical protein